MVEQVIKYSDGSEKVIKYRGIIVDGVLIPDEIKDEEVAEESAPASPVEEAVEAPVEEAPVSEEAPASEEASS